MQITLAAFLRNTPDGEEAQSIVQKCVHCGFCTATCPTYQLLGDELDGPRGRIYLMKQVLEGQPAGQATRLHLDRCLTCRNCESTCPSGVTYGRLVEIVELQDHPWFVASQFHPEFKSRPDRPHPLFTGFVAAAVALANDGVGRAVPIIGGEPAASVNQARPA